MTSLLEAIEAPARVLWSTEQSRAIAAPLFKFIAEAQDGHQLQFIYKRIKNAPGLAVEDINALDKAWGHRFAAINTAAIGNPKPRWKNLL